MNNMIPEKALKLAMDAGWEPEVISENITHHWFGASQNQTISLAKTALDPDFWQALAQGLGIEDKFIDGAKKLTWLSWAYSFTELILTDGDTDAFWQEILK